MVNLGELIYPKASMTKRDYSRNILAGTLVFFLALPLSLAIANASGFPAISGLVTACVGGIVVSIFGGTNLTINGPAAGLIVIVAASVEGIGYQSTIAAIVIVGVMQVFLGFLNIAKYIKKFPELVIKGMMGGIGVIIIIKQIFILLDYAPHRGDMLQLVEQIPAAFAGMDVRVASIGFFAICMMLLSSKFVAKFRILKVIPLPLIIILISIILGVVFNIAHERHHIFEDLARDMSNLFISIPSDIKDAIRHPVFVGWKMPIFWFHVISIFLVGTVETLLSAAAIDKLDPLKRHSDLDRDIKAVGLANSITGFLGGLPMISEIARSSANIQYGATNRISNFTHGILMLGGILFLASSLGYIPLSALAGLLIVVGTRLIDVKHLTSLWRRSRLALLIILTTIVGVVFIDLLIGVFIGFVLYMLAQKFVPHHIHLEIA